jgi:hypothetical protein
MNVEWLGFSDVSMLVGMGIKSISSRPQQMTEPQKWYAVYHNFCVNFSMPNGIAYLKSKNICARLTCKFITFHPHFYKFGRRDPSLVLNLN